MSTRTCRITLYVALLAAAAGCRAPPPRVTAPDRVPPPQAAHEPVEASYDWHGLLIAPLGSVLKDIPAALHEVLLFRDEAHSGAVGDNSAAADAECYATDAPAPRFVGRIPDEYLLCFRRERLSRIQASVRLTATEAPDVLAAACAGWLKHAASGTEGPGAAMSGAAMSGTGAPSVEDQGARGCEGRDGAIRFRGRLGEEPGREELSQTESVLSITLDSAPNL